MGWIKWLLLLLVMVFGLVMGVWFSADNVQPVTVILFGFPLPPVHSGMLICGVLFLGTLLGWLISTLSSLRLRAERSSLQRKLDRREKEVDRLRKAPARG